jgi:hypothetical protein
MPLLLVRMATVAILDSMSASPFLVTGLPPLRIAMDWNADIVQTEARDGTFHAVVRELPLEVVSRDPEHDLCRAMVLAGLADGPIQFWRGQTPSLMYRSVHRTAGYRIELSDSFPFRRRERREGKPEEFVGEGGGAIAGGQIEVTTGQSTTRDAGTDPLGDLLNRAL